MQGRGLQVKAVAEDLKLGFMGMGFNPKWRIADIPIMPKGRYQIMRNYMPKVGTLGLEMMFRTCTVQASDHRHNLDLMRGSMPAAASLQIATALFANSPFTEGKPNGFLSYRRCLHAPGSLLRSTTTPMFEQYRKRTRSRLLEDRGGGRAIRSRSWDSAGRQEVQEGGRTERG
eukprot:SM002394S07880  [mRNA]  locus=s2394:462:1543:+ [translate_table: standard]